MSGTKQADRAATLRPPVAGVPVGMIISANFSVNAFGKRWSHCHQLANYLARFASANEGDPERHSTLLSTFFNELLEAIYRNHAHKGEIKLKFERTGSGVLLLQAAVPVDPLSLQFYRRAVELVSQPDPMTWYRERLERDAPDDDVSVLGLLELAVVYGSKLSIVDPGNGDSLRLAIEFPFIEGDEP